MAPQFDTQTAMIEYFRDLPSTTPYRQMLIEDFGYDVPEDAPDWQTQYFWKYLVQGQNKGLYGPELKQYAFDGTMKMKNEYGVDKAVDNPVEKSVDKKVKKTRTVVAKHPTGTIVFNEQHKKFDGYVDGKVVSRAVTVDKVKACLADRYNVFQFEVKE